MSTAHGLAAVRVAILGSDADACTALGRALALQRPSLCVTATGPDLPGSLPDLTLLCARDIPDAQELQLRAALASVGTAYQVLYGPAPTQLRNALQATDLIAGSAGITRARATFDHKPIGQQQDRLTDECNDRHRLRVRGCEDCVQPQCEHRLFTALRGLEPAV